MRREQYTLRDSYRKIMFSAPTEGYQEEENYEFDVDMEVLPLGAKHGGTVSQLIFREWS